MNFNNILKETGPKDYIMEAPDSTLILKERLALIMDDCPDLLQSIVLKFTQPEEQLMALFATVTLTGAILPNVKINYANQINYPTLMTLFIFPPASGKGVLSMVRKLVSKINNHLIQANNDALTAYQQDFDLYKKALKSSSPLPIPPKPKTPLIVTPGNITSAKLIEQLAHNGPGQALLIYETEIDAYSMSTKGEHGGMNSSIMRQTFHHEPVGQNRKTDSELLQAETPKLAVVLSGTENQVPKLFHSNEDGLYSRFMIIMGTGSAKWMDVKPNNTQASLNELFDGLSETYFEMWSAFREIHTEIKFSDEQWNQINEFGSEKLALSKFTGEFASSIAKRHGNMITRIASILTMMRQFTLCNHDGVIYCDDHDFKVALMMAEISIECSLELYKKLPGNDSKLGNSKLNFMNKLPYKFTTGDLKNIFPDTLSSRTISRWLSEFVDIGLIRRIKLGAYEKLDMAELAVSSETNNYFADANSATPPTSPLTNLKTIN